MSAREYASAIISFLNREDGTETPRVMAYPITRVELVDWAGLPDQPRKRIFEVQNDAWVEASE
jgi:hypothetical protein